MKTYFRHIDGRDESMKQGKLIQLVEIVKEGTHTFGKVVTKSNLRR